MTNLVRSLCFNQLPSGLLDYFSLVHVFRGEKNTLIDYLGHLIDYIVLELFSRCRMNILIDYLDNLINNFVKIIYYLIDLIDYRRL